MSFNSKLLMFLLASSNSNSPVTPVERVFQLGVNLSGSEYEYTQPPTFSEIDYFKTKGVTYIRYPMNWNHMQPTLFGELDSTNLTLVKSFVAYAASVGMTVLLDLHSYGGREDADGNGNTWKFGDGKLDDGQSLGDFWVRMATAFAGLPGIHGFDIMNEPSYMGAAGRWKTAAQITVDAIGTVDTTTKIYCEGDGFASAAQWTRPWQAADSTLGQGGGNNDFILRDTYNRIVYSAHCYPDHDNSGRFSDYDEEVRLSDAERDTYTCYPGTQPNTMRLRLAVFVEWCKLHNLRGHIGELGTPNTDPRWLDIFDDGLTYLVQQGIEVSLWAGGPGWGTSYPYSLEPRPAGVYDAGGDTRQIAVVTKITGAPQDNKYFLSIPERGITGNVSNGFVEYRGSKATPTTITLSAQLEDGTSAGGTFSSSTVVIPAGRNPNVNFTYNANQNARIYIATSNVSGLITPVRQLYATLPDNYMNLTGVNVRNIFALRRVMSLYSGPAVRLKRLDSIEQDFYFDQNGNLPRDAIQAWALDTKVTLTKWYDQSRLGNHMGATIVTPVRDNANPTLDLNNSDGYPEITWAAGNQMEFTSVSYGQTEQTWISRAKNISGAGNMVRQDIYVGPFQFGPGYYSTSGGGYDTSTLSYATSGWHSYGGTFKALTTNGHKVYIDGDVVVQKDAPDFVFSPQFENSNTQIGFFRFYEGSNWVGSIQSLSVFDKALSSVQISAFSADDSQYYSTALPELPILPPTNKVAPVLSGPPVPGQILTGSNGIWTFTPTSYTYQWYKTTGNIAISGATTNTYTVTQADADAGVSVYLKVGATNTAGTVYANSSSVATHNAIAETPYAAPTGTWTPISGTGGYKGVNISGAEEPFPTTQYNYIYPRPVEMDYFVSKGMGTIRMPVLFRRLYPNAYDLLDPINRTDEQPVSGSTVGTNTNLISMKNVLDYAYSKGMRVIIDDHEYGTIYDPSSGTSKNVGDGAGGTALFADAWARVATKFKNYPNVIFGLMNEPANCTAPQFKVAAMAALAAIRATGANQLVLIAGGGSFDDAENFGTLQGTMWDTFNQPGWTGTNGDPADNFAFEGHKYFDTNNDGQNENYRNVTGSQLLGNMTTWCRQTNSGVTRVKPFKAFLGEFGWTDGAYTGANPAVVGASLMDFMSANSDVWLGWTWWVGGSFAKYGAYTHTNLCPTGSVGAWVDRPQMAIVQAHV